MLFQQLGLHLPHYQTQLCHMEAHRDQANREAPNDSFGSPTAISNEPKPKTPVPENPIYIYLPAYKTKHPSNFRIWFRDFRFKCMCAFVQLAKTTCFSTIRQFQEIQFAYIYLHLSFSTPPNFEFWPPQISEKWFVPTDLNVWGRFPNWAYAGLLPTTSWDLDRILALKSWLCINRILARIVAV